MYYLIKNRIIGMLEPLDSEYYTVEPNPPTLDYDSSKIYLLSEEQSDFYNLHKCSLEEVLKGELHLVSLDDHKQTKIYEIKAIAAGMLSETDYKVLRHQDQLAIKQYDIYFEVSMSNEQYTQLLLERQAIRDKSNELETAILIATTIEQIEALSWQH